MSEQTVMLFFIASSFLLQKKKTIQTAMHVFMYFFIDVKFWQYPLFYDDLLVFIFTFVGWT